MGNFLLVSADASSVNIVQTMSTAFSNIQSQCMSAVDSALPVALTIAGVGIVVTFGVKFFKRFAK